jgi:hypothetical protein
MQKCKNARTQKRRSAPISRIGAFVLCLAPALVAQSPAVSYPPAFPRPTAKMLLETDRVVVWDIVWPKGQPTPMHRHVYDQVGTYYAAGGRVITTPDGVSRSTMTQVGALSTTRKGTTHIEEGSTDPPLRAVFIELKHDVASGEPEAPSALPAAFPRDGAKSVLDDERVTIWDYTWRPGTRGIVSRYRRETLLIWLAGGTIRLEPQGGSSSIIEVAPGQIRYQRGGTVETDEALSGSPRAMIVAFK